jgi:protein phosphatase
VGPAGAGKTTSAGRHFEPTQVVSSDAFRAMVADDASDRDASTDAFQVLYLIVDMRLRRGRLTVVDATNVHAKHRLPLEKMARAHGRPLVAIVFSLPLEVCIARDRTRSGRSVGRSVISRQWQSLQRSLPGLAEEGFQDIFLIDSAEAQDQLEVELTASGSSSSRPDRADS